MKQKTRQLQFTRVDRDVMSEISRRIRQFKNGDKNARMVLLAYPSEVKTLIKKGILKPYSEEAVRARNWYDLTEKGKQYF